LIDVVRFVISLVRYLCMVYVFVFCLSLVRCFVLYVAMGFGRSFFMYGFRYVFLYVVRPLFPSAFLSLFR